MKIDKALVELKCGNKVRRTDWNDLAPAAYIELLEWNHVMEFYITGKVGNAPELQERYGMSYEDLISTTWVVA